MEIEREDEGKFKKGKSANPNGRPKGSPNKTPAEIRTALLDIFTEGFDKLKRELATLKGRDYVNAHLAIYKIVLPPLAPEQADDSAQNLYTHPETLIQPPKDETETDVSLK